MTNSGERAAARGPAWSTAGLSPSRSLERKPSARPAGAPGSGPCPFLTSVTSDACHTLRNTLSRSTAGPWVSEALAPPAWTHRSASLPTPRTRLGAPSGAAGWWRAEAVWAPGSAPRMATLPLREQGGASPTDSSMAGRASGHRRGPLWDTAGPPPRGRLCPCRHLPVLRGRAPSVSWGAVTHSAARPTGASLWRGGGGSRGLARTQNPRKTEKREHPEGSTGNRGLPVSSDQMPLSGLRPRAAPPLGQGSPSAKTSASV